MPHVLHVGDTVLDIDAADGAARVKSFANDCVTRSVADIRKYKALLCRNLWKKRED